MTREERYIEYDERIDRYLRRQMDESERAAFEQDVDNNEELRERLVATAMLARGVAQAGMQREGQAQIDAIRQMTRAEYFRAAKGKRNRQPWWSFMKWASGIAALAVIAYGFYALRPLPSSTKSAEHIVLVEKTSTEHEVSKQPASPTLADLADEYNRPFGSEPDEFASIREQIKKGNSQDMMAVVYDIDKVEWPTAKHGYKGADDGDETRYTTGNFNDCTHWYKALAYLKAGDKESALKELNDLLEHGQNDNLMELATDLLKKLPK